MHREGHRESHKEGRKEHMHKEHMHKESPTRHIKEKEVQRPTPPPIIVPPPPMPEPQMIPIPYPMPMPMPQPAPVELSWNQNVVMPSVEQNVSPIQIQPQPVAQPEAPPPAPMPQPILLCHKCQQYHIVQAAISQCIIICIGRCRCQCQCQCLWNPKLRRIQCQSNLHVKRMRKVAGAGDFLESSTSPFFPMSPEYQQMPEMEQPCGCHAQPAMMPTWQMDQCYCPPPCPPPCPMPCPSHCHMPHSSVGPWMSPHFSPGGMTPYRW